MPLIDLSQFGFPCVEIAGKIADSWTGGERVVFLFGEHHKDGEMKKRNVLDALTLTREKRIGFIGTELPILDLADFSAASIKDRFSHLFELYQSDLQLVLALYEIDNGSWFDFGKSLRILRTEIPLRCVEDQLLRHEARCLQDQIANEIFFAGKDDFEFHERFLNHPIQPRREAAMVDNLLSYWNDSERGLAAILNTGTAHSKPIASRLRDQGISYFLIQHPATKREPL